MFISHFVMDMELFENINASGNAIEYKVNVSKQDIALYVMRILLLSKVWGKNDPYLTPI